MKKYIVVNLQFEAVHRWKNCPLDNVFFLKEYHRHIFHIKAIRSVTHNDREIEIISFKRELEAWLKTTRYGMDFGDWSCEDMAEDICREFDCQSVEVLEDGENGAMCSHKVEREGKKRG